MNIGFDRTNRVLIFAASFFLGAGFALGGYAIGMSTSDPCRDAFSVSERVLQVNTEVMNASTAGIRASKTGDAAASAAATDRLDRAIKQLDEIQPEYERAADKCRK